MSLLDRMSTVVKAKMNKIIGNIEDPSETLDYSYEKQIELLQNIKRSIADVATSKKRLEMQKSKLQESINRNDAQASEAMESNREDLARMALEQKVASQAQAESLDQQITELKNEQEKLMAAESRMATKIESFRAKKETIKAQYSAAEAQVKITESVTGISEEMADVGLTVQRAEDKTNKMKARSTALDELLESGTLEDYSSGDQIEKELAKVQTKSRVDEELAKLKQEAGK